MKAAARKTTAATKRTARKARWVPASLRPKVRSRVQVASEGDLAIARYDALTADEVNTKLTGLSQIDLRSGYWTRTL